jgi:hypothetical protein
MSTTIPSAPRQSEQLEAQRAASPNGDSGWELAAELARLRERFAAYEHLDKQLDDMVAGLTELLQGATELRRRTNKDIVEALARCEALIATDRSQHRDLLTGLQVQIDAAQRRAATLATAVSGLQHQLAGLTQQLPTPSTEQPGLPSTPVIASDADRTVVQMTIRGVPSVATALTLQRYIGGLRPVAAIRAREFAGGELRLQLELTEPFPDDELRRLPTRALTVVEAKPERLILRYDPPAMP